MQENTAFSEAPDFAPGPGKQLPAGGRERGIQIAPSRWHHPPGLATAPWASTQACPGRVNEPVTL